MERIKILFLVVLLLFSNFSFSQDSTISTGKIKTTWVSPKLIFSEIPLTESEKQSIIRDDSTIDIIDKNYDKLSSRELNQLNSALFYLTKIYAAEKDSLQRIKANIKVIESKEWTLDILSRDKRIVELTILRNRLASKQGILLSEKQKLRRYLIYASVGLFIVLLLTLILFLRFRIKTKNNEIIEQLNIVNKKNSYLEYAAKIIRHDMHSGINTYIPRGISSLERRLTSDVISSLKLETPLKILKEGLAHSQKVYKGVYEFTNLVKKDAVLNKESCDLKKILTDYLSNTTYSSQVVIQDLPTVDVNQSLFCTAVDNLIRNGLKYNDSDSKRVDIYMNDNYMCIQDNGRGMTQEEFENLSKPYTRKEKQKETGTGLGLNICLAILHEHNFDVLCEKNEIGTKLKIKIRDND